MYFVLAPLFVGELDNFHVNTEKKAVVRFFWIFRYYRTTPDSRRAKWEQLFMYNQMDKEAGSLDDVKERGL